MPTCSSSATARSNLDAANTYAGTTQIGLTGGTGTTTVQIGHDSAFSTGSVTLGAGSGGTIGFANLEAVGAARSLANTVVLGQNSTISGSLALTVANLSFSQAATRTLTVSNSALTTFTQITSASNFALTLGASSGNIAIGSLVQSSNTTRLALTTSGVTTISGSPLDLGTNSDTVAAVILDSGSITSSTGVLTGASYDVRSGSASAILADSGVALTKSTAGTVTLTGANTYTGGTTISGGILNVNANAALGDVSGGVAMSGGATLQAAGDRDDGGPHADLERQRREDRHERPNREPERREHGDRNRAGEAGDRHVEPRRHADLQHADGDGRDDQRE